MKKITDISILINKRAELERQDMLDTLKDCYKEVTQKFPEMSGFAFVAWGEGGESRTCFYIGNGSNVNTLQMPETVKILLSNDILNIESEIEFELEDDS